ncbi:NAD(P)/FAD-dependent oxidoreductase [Rhodococcoides fascians]|uniref:NAD(P)/FAD-dependent oxidoreductase n=1 Tax=Rhodococcoides fascians TaxID=1828 RepID=UPI00050C2BE0|nr:FAD-dependent oxidoreductase [Rhodococcus fascians]
MSVPRRLVVVGASLAGLRAVEAARGDGFDGEIVLIGDEAHLPYDRPPLSKAFLDGTESAPFRTLEHLVDDLHVDVRLGSAATSLDLASRTVSVGSDAVEYDGLVIATGARARTLPSVGALGNVHGLRSVDDAASVRSALDAGARTVVIGAGFIGAEIASNARSRGLEVTIVEALPTPLVRAVGPVMGEALGRLHDANGVQLICGTGVESFIGTDTVEGVVLMDGRRLDADLVVVGVGSQPNIEWLEQSDLNLQNGVKCDATLWTGAPGVYAAGDVANWYNAATGTRQRLEHWTSAAEQGAAAGRNACNPQLSLPYSTVPYFWSDWYGNRIQFVGSPVCDDVVAVEGTPGEDQRWVALYRRHDTVVGALTVNAQSEIMKYRGLIGRCASWTEATAFAEQRNAARRDRLSASSAVE